MDRPLHGVSVKGRVVKIIDGDTLDFEITRRVRVRLIGCWAPEVHGVEKTHGLAASQHLKELALGADGTLFIPTEEAHSMADVLTLGRLLGRVWIEGSDIELSDAQVIAGHATRVKK